jgi:hypothetical protein
VSAAPHDPPGSTFCEAEIAALDEPVQRYFRAAIAQGTPLFTAARISMRGHIKIGRWVPFHATELLAPMAGFLWRATAAGVISGFDRYVSGEGRMQWRLAGLVTVLEADGPEVARSAAGRAAAEGVWVPTALLPRYGVDWDAVSDCELVARFSVDQVAVELRLEVDRSGALTAVSLPRWGDPDGDEHFGLHRFGGPVRASRPFAGVTVPSEGSVGWHPSTDRWSDGEFFRYRVTGIDPIPPSP